MPLFLQTPAIPFSPPPSIPTAFSDPSPAREVPGVSIRHSPFPQVLAGVRGGGTGGGTGIAMLGQSDQAHCADCHRGQPGPQSPREGPCCIKRKEVCSEPNSDLHAPIPCLASLPGFPDELHVAVESHPDFDGWRETSGTNGHQRGVFHGRA